jgi:hypothetical protein
MKQDEIKLWVDKWLKLKSVTSNEDKEFVPYKLALKLKKLGLNEDCFAFYESDNKLIIQNCKVTDFNSDSLQCVAPLFQQVFRWFREPKNGSLNHLDFMYEYLKYDSMSSMSYEEAELACLTKLIEILETRTN